MTIKIPIYQSFMCVPLLVINIYALQAAFVKMKAIFFYQREEGPKIHYGKEKKIERRKERTENEKVGGEYLKCQYE